MKSLSRVRLFETLWTAAYQAPLSMRFSRQKYWSGLPFPSPGDLPNPGIEPGSPVLESDALTSEPAIHKREKIIPKMVKDGIISKNNCFKRHSGDFSGSLVLEHPPSSTGDTDLIPGWGTKIPHAAEPTKPACHN